MEMDERNEKRQQINLYCYVEYIEVPNVNPNFVTSFAFCKGNVRGLFQSSSVHRSFRRKKLDLDTGNLMKE